MSNTAHYVVLHISQGSLPRWDASSDPMGKSGRFALTDDMWVERLDAELAKLIIRACEPPGHNTTNDGNDRHLYAFIRRVPENEGYKFEGLQLLLGAIALSRVIYPTTTGFRYCAWVSDLTSGDPTILSFPYKGIGPDVLLGNSTRDYLTENDGVELRRLMAWLPLASSPLMHQRVHRAYWNHEYALRLYEVDVRWPMIVSGLEALVNTGDNGAKWQFRDRCLQLAIEFNVSLSDDDLMRAYRVRSSLVHSERFLFAQQDTVPMNEQHDLYQRLETLLRLTVRRCLLDAEFYDRFKDKASVKRCFPLRPNPNARVCPAPECPMRLPAPVEPAP